jgi:hypothetical protein
MVSVMLCKIGQEWLTSLGNGDNVMTSQNCGDAVGLNGGRVGVLAELDVLEHDGVETCVLELTFVSMGIKEQAE